MKLRIFKLLHILLCSLIPFSAGAAGNYRNFTVSVYARVYEVLRMDDPAWLEPRWNEMSRQVKIDKIYLETHRDMKVAGKETILKLKRFFQDRGVSVAGGITATVNEMNRFETFCYTNPEHRKRLKEVVEFTAGLFDEIIFDDFFFTNCKCDSCIRAKGAKSWTRFRLDLMDEAARELVIKPAKAVNPKVKLVIKYPNWYEHFQGLGFNLETEPKLFDGIYTGTETRDRTGDQHLQEYLGYSIFRYFENIKPGGNGGGWVDTAASRYLDRYAEQLWLTLFAKAPEITLFDFAQLQRQIRPSDRAPWQGQQTSFDFDKMMQPYAQPDGSSAKPTVTIASAAAFTFDQVDGFLGKLGKPVGLKSYKPYHSTGEDFLQTYLGMVGIPVDLVPEFPKEASTVLLTESAAADPLIVAKIKGQLSDGKSVVITSGLLRALQGKGIEEIAEIKATERKAVIKGFRQAPVASDLHIIIPELQYLTNDAWELVSGMTQNDLGYPLLIQAGYSKGTLYVLTIPENFSDLYSYPSQVLTQIRNVLLRDFPVRIESPGDVSLFVYDNNTFIVESFLPEAVDIRISLDPKNSKLRDLVSGEEFTAQAAPKTFGFGGFGASGGARLVCPLQIKPHSYRVLSVVP